MYSLTHSLTDLLIHLLAYSLTYSLTNSYSLTHSLTYSLTYSLTHLLTHSLTLTYSLFQQGGNESHQLEVFPFKLLFDRERLHQGPAAAHNEREVDSLTHLLTHLLTHRLTHSLVRLGYFSPQQVLEHAYFREFENRYSLSLSYFSLT